MAITAGQNANASDFVSSPSGASDSGKVAKLDAQGRLDPDFGYTLMLHVVPTTVDLGASTSETDLISKSVPANLLVGTNVIEIEAFFSDLDWNGATSLTFRLKIGATTLITFSPSSSGSISNLHGRIKIQIYANSSSSAQRATMETDFIENSASANTDSAVSYIRQIDVGTASEAMTSAKTIVLTAQKSSASSHIVMASATMKLYGM